MEEVVSNFNTIALEFMSQISMIAPSSFIANNNDIFIRIIKQEPKKVIELFVMYVLKYKQQIDSGDENFFINNSFATEIGDNSDIIGKVFEFKNIWSKLSKQNKNIVQQYMQCLCEYAFQYLEFITNNKR
jgi:hypothetical protein